jgi:hypothetical protein
MRIDAGDVPDAKTILKIARMLDDRSALSSGPRVGNSQPLAVCVLRG